MFQGYRHIMAGSRQEHPNDAAIHAPTGDAERTRGGTPGVAEQRDEIAAPVMGHDEGLARRADPHAEDDEPGNDKAHPGCGLGVARSR